VGASAVDAPEGIRRELKADEDDNGAVRSEGSGPQSWAIVPTVTAASGDLRRSDMTYEDLMRLTKL